MRYYLRAFWLLVALGPSRALAQDSTQAELIFLDVGQADAIVVRSPEGKTALIDAGRMEQVLRTFPVRYYMDNGADHTTTTYLSLMAQLERSDVVYLEPTARTIALGSVTLRILPPPAEGDHNNRSVGVVVEFGDFKAILSGDSEWAELEHFLAQGVPDVAVLKAAHHGSYNGVSPAWSITRGWVMKPTRRIASPHRGHRSGSSTGGTSRRGRTWLIGVRRPSVSWIRENSSRGGVAETRPPRRVAAA